MCISAMETPKFINALVNISSNIISLSSTTLECEMFLCQAITKMCLYTYQPSHLSLSSPHSMCTLHPTLSPHDFLKPQFSLFFPLSLLLTLSRVVKGLTRASRVVIYLDLDALLRKSGLGGPQSEAQSLREACPYQNR